MRELWRDATCSKKRNATRTYWLPQSDHRSIEWKPTMATFMRRSVSGTYVPKYGSPAKLTMLMKKWINFPQWKICMIKSVKPWHTQKMERVVGYSVQGVEHSMYSFLSCDIYGYIYIYICAISSPRRRWSLVHSPARCHASNQQQRWLPLPRRRNERDVMTNDVPTAATGAHRTEQRHHRITAYFYIRYIYGFLVYR